MIDAAKIEQRAAQIAEWLSREYPETFFDQGHLDAGTTGRGYWHHGYMMALRDVIRPDKTIEEALEGLP